VTERKATSRAAIEEAWRDLLDSRRQSEDVASWAKERLASLPGVQIMEEIALQQLAGVTRGLTRTGEFVDRDDPLDYLDQWLAQCAAYDQDPSGLVLLSEDESWGLLDRHRLRLLGTFSGSWQGAGILESPAAMTIDEAIAWGRRYSDTVEIWCRDELYSAGVNPVEGMPVWTGDLDLSPVESHLPGEEWRGGLSGEAIAWDVVLSPSAPGISDQAGFPDAFLAALDSDPEATIAPAAAGVALSKDSGFAGPSFVLRVVATNDDDAQSLATRCALRAFLAAGKVVGANGPIGWTMGCKAQPAKL
jgi:hypothetical protein